METAEILSDVHAMYQQHDELEKRMYTKMHEYCDVLNKRYENQMGEKIETVRTEYDLGFTFFGGFKVEYNGKWAITPILYYPTTKNKQSKRKAITIPSQSKQVIEELEKKRDC